MGVRVDGTVAWQGHLVLTEKLAVRKCRVSLDTGIWSDKVKVVEVESVDVTRSELSRLDAQIVEEASSLVHGGNVSTANVGDSIARFLSGVLPAVFLNHSHHIFDRLVLLGRKHRNLLDVLAFDTKALVKGLGKEVEGDLGHDLLQDREDNRHSVVRDQRWPVVFGGVDPTIQEVVVAVRQTFSLEEEVLSGLFVEFLANVRSQWQP